MRGCRRAELQGCGASALRRCSHPQRLRAGLRVEELLACLRLRSAGGAARRGRRRRRSQVRVRHGWCAAVDDLERHGRGLGYDVLQGERHRHELVRRVPVQDNLGLLSPRSTLPGRARLPGCIGTCCWDGGCCRPSLQDRSGLLGGRRSGRARTTGALDGSVPIVQRQRKHALRDADLIAGDGSALESTDVQEGAGRPTLHEAANPALTLQPQLDFPARR